MEACVSELGTAISSGSRKVFSYISRDSLLSVVCAFLPAVNRKSLEQLLYIFFDAIRYFYFHWWSKLIN